MDGWMGGWVDGWMGGWVDGWVDGWMGGWGEIYPVKKNSKPLKTIYFTHRGRSIDVFKTYCFVASKLIYLMPRRPIEKVIHLIYQPWSVCSVSTDKFDVSKLIHFINQIQQI